MTSQSKFHLIFNTVGALIGITVVGYIVYSLLHSETETACRARYPAATRLGLQTSDGALMSTLELQARAGVDEYGINENAKMIADAPGGVAIEVTLAPVAEVESRAERSANGIFFRWTPPGIGAATAGCLSYMLWLPDDFDFGMGGLLPGIVGEAKADESGSAAPTLGARPQWRGEGEAALNVAPSGSNYAPVTQSRFPLPKGRWVRIEQELVLNTPGQADGVARLWLDGDLMAESTHVVVREDDRAAIRGVLADIGYTISVPAKPGTLRITPFEMAWK
jgi:Polysaccharide lyase 14